MTKRKFFLVLFLISGAVFAIFVWPTRYRQIQEANENDPSVRPMRVDRLSHRVEIQEASGKWVEYAPPPPDFDPLTDTDAGRGISKTKQAESDIRKMNDVVNETTKKGAIGR